jgi:conjugal transfer pilus assembly protein TraU
MVQATSAIAAKAMALTARLGISKRTLGDDAICASQPMPLIRKSMFKLQMLFPVSETSLSPSTPGAPPSITDPPQQVPLGDASGGQVGQANPTALESVFTGRCTHAIGAPTMRWGAWRHIPATGEDAVYLEWKWTDCCIGYTAN